MPLVYPALTTIVWPSVSIDALMVRVFAPVVAIDVGLLIISGRCIGRVQTKSRRSGWVLVLILASIGTVLATLYVGLGVIRLLQ